MMKKTEQVVFGLGYPECYWELGSQKQRQRQQPSQDHKNQGLNEAA